MALIGASTELSGSNEAETSCIQPSESPLAHISYTIVTMISSLQIPKHRQLLCLCHLTIPLLSSQGEFRILHLDAAADPKATIKCSLKRVLLSSKPHCEALSYTWGRPGTYGNVQLDGQDLQVHENLLAALRRLRHTKRARTLWIDAICILLCIDQRNLDERRDQVSLMGSIYEHADQVVVWLGELTTDGLVGTKMLDNYFKYIWQSIKTEKQKHGYSLAHWKKTLSNSVNLRECADYVDEHGLGEVRELLDRPWWRRVWIIQEAVLARRLVLVCGTELIQWQSS